MIEILTKIHVKITIIVIGNREPYYFIIICKCKEVPLCLFYNQMLASTVTMNKGSIYYKVYGCRWPREEWPTVTLSGGKKCQTSSPLTPNEISVHIHMHVTNVWNILLPLLGESPKKFFGKIFILYNFCLKHSSDECSIHT